MEGTVKRKSGLGGRRSMNVGVGEKEAVQNRVVRANAIDRKWLEQRFEGGEGGEGVSHVGIRTRTLKAEWASSLRKWVWSVWRILSWSVWVEQREVRLTEDEIDPADYPLDAISCSLSQLERKFKTAPWMNKKLYSTFWTWREPVSFTNTQIQNNITLHQYSFTKS